MTKTNTTTKKAEHNTEKMSNKDLTKTQGMKKTCAREGKWFMSVIGNHCHTWTSPKQQT
jgi:hypothetical protein